MAKSGHRPNQKEWRERVKFGLRWLVENVTSAFKRALGESVGALLPHTAYIEIDTKMERSPTTAPKMSGTGPSGWCARGYDTARLQPRRAALCAPYNQRPGSCHQTTQTDAPLTRFGPRTRANRLMACRAGWVCLAAATDT